MKDDVLLKLYLANFRQKIVQQLTDAIKPDIESAANEAMKSLNAQLIQDVYEMKTKLVLEIRNEPR